MTLIRLAILFITSFAVNAQPDAGLGQNERFVDQGSRSLRSSGFPWYDASKEELRHIEQPTSGRQPDWTGPRLNLGPLFSQIIQVAFIVILVAVICGIIYLLLRAFLRRERNSEASGELVKVITDEARIEELPFNIADPNRDLLEQARLHYQKGEFNQAIVYLYSYMLLHLDKNHIIRLSKGKTNRQYLVELKGRPVLLTLLERTMVSFEDAFFGSHTLDRGAFEHCWTELDRFHTTVSEASQ